MPETRRRSKATEPVAPESLASSRPLRTKRRRTSARGRVAELAAAPSSAAQRTHSNVGSSQQPDTRTDSSEVPAPTVSNQPLALTTDAAAAPTTTTAGTMTTVAPAAKRPRRAPIPSPAVLEQEVEPAAIPPPPRRHYVSRARIPAPLTRDALRVTDRYSGPFNADTDEGHYVFTIGDNLTPRFKIMRKFGEGTFGRVMECWDRRRSGYVAIKVIRAVDKYRDAAMVELQVLTTLAINDPEQRYPIVRLLEWFDYRGHVCMVFDRLGPSMYDCLRRNAYRPFPLDMARAFLKQLLEAVAYMHQFSLVHTDLKPENILFLDDAVADFAAPAGSKLARKLPPQPKIRLIDFGSATFDEDYHSSIVSTRHYRAPEIILGLGWSRPCDMWSLGCILVELLTGDALFQTHENLEHLAMMETAVGPMPSSMAERGHSDRTSTPAVQALFKSEPSVFGPVLNWPEGAAGKRSLRAVAKLKPLREYLKTQGDSSLAPHLDVIEDLCRKFMEWDPQKRITAEEALKHPFFSLNLPITFGENGAAGCS